MKKIEIICHSHGSFWQRPNHHTSLKNGCPSCPSIISSPHQQIINMIPENIKFVNNDRTFFNGLEIDVYFPNFNFGVEIHDVYWHSCRNNNRSKHLKYTNLHALKANIAAKTKINLYQFWDFEIEKSQTLIQSMIYNQLGLSNKIYARKCEIVQLKNSEASEFFNCWEIIRYACRLNTTVVGGFQRLLKRFIIENNPSQILTFADRRISVGNLYSKSGFKTIEITKPNHFYTKSKTVLSRQKCQKSKLKKMLKEGFDENLSQKENMLQNGFNQVHDAGHIKMMWFK